MSKNNGKKQRGEGCVICFSCSRWLIMTCLFAIAQHDSYAQNVSDSILAFVYAQITRADSNAISAKSCINHADAIFATNLPKDKAKLLEVLNFTIRIAEKRGTTSDRARANYNLSRIYIVNGKGFASAIPPLLKSLSVYQEINDSLGISRCYMQLGLIGYITQYFEDAIKHFELSLKYNDYPTSAYLMAITYTELENYSEAKKKFLHALNSYLIRHDTTGIVQCYMYLGDMYTDEGHADSAYIFLNKAIKIQKTKKRIRELSRPHALISKYFMAFNQRDSAKYYAFQSLEASADDYDDLSAMIASEILSKAFELEKDYHQAHKFLKMHYKLKHENVQGSTKQKIAEMQGVFEFNKRMTEEKHRHEVEIREKNRFKNVLLASVLFALIVALGLYSRLTYVRKTKAALQEEKNISEALLLNILPEEVAMELKESGKSEARNFDMVSVLFTDFKEFTQTSEKLSATELVNEIHMCFEAFDGIVEKYGIEKIKTIGDAYMAAGGLPVPTNQSVKNTVLAALNMQTFISSRKEKLDAKGKPAFEMRVGIHTGPVVAGIVGVKKFQYDIWGDTVNTANRMEANGEVAKVNISQATYELIKNDPEFIFENRGKIEAKGKGLIDMWFVSLNKSQVNSAPFVG